jgi:Uri superfamily endonuclease
VVDDKRLECKLAEQMEAKSEGIEKFGCSDCRCPSHLFYFKKLEDLKENCVKCFEILGLSPLSYLEDKKK